MTLFDRFCETSSSKDDQAEHVSIFDIISEAYENFSENMLISTNKPELIAKLISPLINTDAMSIGKVSSMLTKVINSFKRNKGWKGLDMFTSEVSTLITSFSSIIRGKLLQVDLTNNLSS